MGIQRFRLSPALAEVVGAAVMPRLEVVKTLNALIKKRKLQDPKDTQFVICDEQLLKLFGELHFSSLISSEFSLFCVFFRDGDLYR